MADMLVKLFQTASSQETEKDLSDSGIRIKRALAPDRRK